MNAEPVNAEPRGPVRVRQGRYALHFHTNVCGATYWAVADDQATVFDSAAAACARAIKHGLAPGQFVLEPLESL